MKAVIATIWALVINSSAAQAAEMKVLKTTNVVQQTLEVDISKKCHPGFISISGAVYTCAVKDLGLPRGGEILGTESAGVKLDLDGKIWLEAQTIGAIDGMNVAFMAFTMKPFPDGSSHPRRISLDQEQALAARNVVIKALDSELKIQVLYQGPALK